MYIRISGRLLVNAASMNAQGVVGNVVELTKVHLTLFRNGSYDIVEVPAVTGNSLKHWHFIHFIEQYKRLGGSHLCKDCIRGIGYRTRMYQNKRDIGNDEADYIKGCAGEDLHGFLMPDKQVRRESLVKFSFLVPIEDILEYPLDTVTHNRVVLTEGGRIEAEAAMMLFKRQYASNIYGFSSTLDLGLIGVRLYSPDKKPVIEPEERILRAKASILAFIPMLSGKFGANMSRSLPAERVEQLIVATSRNPIPLLVNGMYSDYVDKSLKVLENYCKSAGIEATLHTYGVSVREAEKVEIQQYDDWSDIFVKLAEEVEKSLGASTNS